MSTDLTRIPPILTEPAIWDVRIVKKEPEEESNLPNIKVEHLTQDEIKEEPKTDFNVYIKQELNVDEDTIDIKKESDIDICNISDYSPDIETLSENDYEIPHLIPKFEPKYDIRNNSDTDDLNIEGNLFKITMFDQDSQNNISEYEDDSKFSNDSEYYSCNFCKGYFVSIDTRDRHIPYCAKKKKAKSTKNIEDCAKTSLKCCICDAIFSDKIKLHNHICGEIRENPYVCEICHRQFSRKSGLKNHSKIHNYVPGRECLNS